MNGLHDTIREKKDKRKMKETQERKEFQNKSAFQMACFLRVELYLNNSCPSIQFQR